MLKSKIDISALCEFHKALKYLESESEREKLIRKCLIEIAKRLLRRTRKRTPTNTSALKNSFKIGHIKKIGNMYEVEVFSDSEYADFVENGFLAHFVPGHWEGDEFVYDKEAKTGMQVGKPGGWVRGFYMLRISAKEVEAQMPRIIERELEKFIKKKLK